VRGKIIQSELVEEVATATAKACIAGGVITGILLTLSMIFPPIAVLWQCRSDALKLWQGACVVMDNAKIHCGAMVKELSKRQEQS